MTDDNLRVIWLQICFAGAERQISTSQSAPGCREISGGETADKPEFCPRVDQSSGSASLWRRHQGSGHPAVIRRKLTQAQLSLYLSLYLKCLLQLLQLVGGEDGAVPPFLLLLLPEDAGDISTQARLVQLPCKRWLVVLSGGELVSPPVLPSPRIVLVYNNVSSHHLMMKTNDFN